GRGRASRATAGLPPDSAPQADDEELFQCLRALRSRLAKEQGVPPYVVFSDKSLRSMVQIRPADEETFLLAHGVGDKKAELYGAAFLSAIAEFSASGECPG
ncbi:MAG TPA: HRDC domain-containing protein, partial [Spirochaetia bacterium]|nr:HRDC domain-containing protein [Spirochaetia bacterium]